MRYLITLQPVSYYYFGSEANFSTDKEANYYAKSLLFPPQTTILGMIRREILYRKGVLKVHKKGEWIDEQDKIKAKRLVGNEPFDFEREIDLGIIDSISEVFLVYGNQQLYQAPFDMDYDPKKSDRKVSFNGIKKSYLAINYDPKNEPPTRFIGNNQTFNQNEIFSTTTIIGNDKQKKLKNQNDDAFFMKDCHILNKEFRFGFFLETSEEVELEGIVKLGGEGSKFYLQQHDPNTLERFDIARLKKTLPRYWLVSEAIVDEAINDKSLFQWAKISTLRAISQKIDDYKKYKAPKTKRYQAFNRGSTLYGEALEPYLDKPHLQKIGLNQYKEL